MNKKYKAILTIHYPHKKGGEKSYEGRTVELFFDAADEEAAKRHCSIEAMSRQKSMRAHKEVGVTVRFVGLKEEKAAG